MSVNSAILVGRLTRDLQIIPNKNGSKTVLFTLAVQRNRKDKDGNRQTDYIPVKAFIAKDAKSNGPFDYMSKGQLVAIEAELRSSQYEKDGQTVYGLDVTVKQNGVSLIERAKNSDPQTVSTAAEKNEDVSVDPMDISDDDLPF